MRSIAHHTPANGWVRWAARLGLLLLTVQLLVGCASQTLGRPAGPRPEPEFAQPPSASGRLAALEATISEKYGPDRSGFNLLERSDRAVLWRLALIDSATQSIDLQYYVWFGDTLGRLVMDRVIKAADRGVKVRILFDDLSTMLHDMSHMELRDALMAAYRRWSPAEAGVLDWSRLENR